MVEDPQYSRDYLDPDKRSIANAVQVFFKDGTQTENVVVEYPLGHRRRRQEGLPGLLDKFETHLDQPLPGRTRRCHPGPVPGRSSPGGHPGQ